jgi:hypothetical protein
MLKRLLLVVISAIFVTGCVGQTPLVKISQRIDQMQIGPIHEMAAKDIKASLEWANSLADPEKRFAASQCPMAIQFAHEGNTKDIDAIQQLTLGFEARLNALAAGDSPMILLMLLKMQYGEEVNDPTTQISALKKRVFDRYILVRNSCFGVIPEQKLVELGMRYFGVGF